MYFINSKMYLFHILMSLKLRCVLIIEGMSFPTGIHFLLVVQNVIAHLTINGILYLMNCDIRKWEIKFDGLSNYKALLSSISYKYAAKYAYM